MTAQATGGATASSATEAEKDAERSRQRSVTYIEKTLADSSNRGFLVVRARRNRHLSKRYRLCTTRQESSENGRTYSDNVGVLNKT
jgi:hypothetical protein